MFQTLSSKIGTMTSNRKHWQPVLDDLQKKIDREKSQLREFRKEHGQAVLLAENGDQGALVIAAKISSQVTESEQRISSLQDAIEAAKDSELQSKMSHESEEQRKRIGRIKHLHRELDEAAADIDKSLVTLGQRYEKLSSVTDALLAETGRSNIQLVEDVLSPRKNLARCLASHLPRHSGFERHDDEPLPVVSLVPSFEGIKSTVEKH